ncbi:unnamed protein product [Diamesa serratosioi]
MKLIVGVVFALLVASAAAGVEPMTETNRVGRITNGREVIRNTHPYQAGLLISTSIFGTSLCGGSIISARNVLTSASCIQGTRNTQVVLGAHRITTANEVGQQRQTVQPANYRIHSQFNPQTFFNDIALLLLPTAVVFNSFIQPSNLPTGGEISNLWVNSLGTITGWGQLNDGSTTTALDLRYVQNNIMSNAACADTFGSIITPSNICMATTGGRSSCTGDSGGPLSVQRNGRSMLIGIVSFGRASGCQGGNPAAYARVTSFLPWIQSTMATMLPSN